MGIFVGTVKSITDEYDGGRIKVYISPDDKGKSETDLDYAFPLLPKMFNVIPKVNEEVIILTTGEDSRTQRYYIGPIISQPQNLFLNSDTISNLALMKGGNGYRYPTLGHFYGSKGSFADEDEVAMYSRKNSDVILSDNDVRIRCGSRIMKPNALKVEEKVVFNRKNPSYLKLNYYESPLESKDEAGKTIQIGSSANIVGNYINILSTDGSPYIKGITDAENKLISDETLKEIIASAHPLPWGDKLVNFLNIFVKAFNTHTHKYHNLPPCPSSSFNALQDASKNLYNDILSKHIRIN